MATERHKIATERHKGLQRDTKDTKGLQRDTNMTTKGLQDFYVLLHKRTTIPRLLMCCVICMSLIVHVLRELLQISAH